MSRLFALALFLLAAVGASGVVLAYECGAHAPGSWQSGNPQDPSELEEPTTPCYELEPSQVPEGCLENGHVECKEKDFGGTHYKKCAWFSNNFPNEILYDCPAFEHQTHVISGICITERWYADEIQDGFSYAGAEQSENCPAKPRVEKVLQWSNLKQLYREE